MLQFPYDIFERQKTNFISLASYSRAHFRQRGWSEQMWEREAVFINEILGNLTYLKEVGVDSQDP